jgi:hypothetical protein
MKNILILIIVVLGFGCTKDEVKPQPPFYLYSLDAEVAFQRYPARNYLKSFKAIYKKDTIVLHHANDAEFTTGKGFEFSYFYAYIFHNIGEEEITIDLLGKEYVFDIKSRDYVGLENDVYYIGDFENDTLDIQVNITHVIPD